jgi:hypothetical protein
MAQRADTQGDWRSTETLPAHAPIPMFLMLYRQMYILPVHPTDIPLTLQTLPQTQCKVRRSAAESAA